jgi:hypothetical protein
VRHNVSTSRFSARCDPPDDRAKAAKGRDLLQLFYFAARSAGSTVLLSTAARRHRVVSPKNPAGAAGQDAQFGSSVHRSSNSAPLFCYRVRCPPRRHATVCWKRETEHAVPPTEPGTIMIVKTASLPRLSGPRSGVTLKAIRCRWLN